MLCAEHTCGKQTVVLPDHHKGKAVMKKLHVKATVILVTLLMALSSAVYADRGDRDRRDMGFRGDRHDTRDPNFRLDSRYHHDRRYPREGYMVRTLPPRRHTIHYRNHNYFYFGGVWYQPSGPSFVVVQPPIGIFVPILPPYYTTIWLHDRPYYYANDVYYVWRPDLSTYEVVSPPVAENADEPPLMADQLFIYPKQGQSEQQQADDRYACHSWGVKQTGYDPTEPPDKLSASELTQKRQEYQRAMKACLEGKGYSVR